MRRGQALHGHQGPIADERLSDAGPFAYRLVDGSRLDIPTGLLHSSQFLPMESSAALAPLFADLSVESPREVMCQAKFSRASR